MIIDAISDLHGFFPKNLEGGDILIVAGDLTARHAKYEYIDFIEWLVKQSYNRKIVIGGNHDHLLESEPDFFDEYIDLDYLCDSGEEINGIKIWGTPYTPSFRGQNPLAAAFSLDSEEALERHFDLIPQDTDILICHGPPYGILDGSYDGGRCGSKALVDKIADIRPELVIFGHIHEKYGVFEKQWEGGSKTTFFNVSHVNKNYEPVNEPVRIIYER